MKSFSLSLLFFVSFYSFAMQEKSLVPNGQKILDRLKPVMAVIPKNYSQAIGESIVGLTKSNLTQSEMEDAFERITALEYEVIKSLSSQENSTLVSYRCRYFLSKLPENFPDRSEMEKVINDLGNSELTYDQAEEALDCVNNFELLLKKPKIIIGDKIIFVDDTIS